MQYLVRETPYRIQSKSCSFLNASCECVSCISCIIKVCALIIDIIIIMQTIISVLRLRMYVCATVAIRKMAVNTNGWWNKKVVQFRLFPNEKEWMGESEWEWVICRNEERQFFALNNNQPYRHPRILHSAMTPIFSRMTAHTHSTRTNPTEMMLKERKHVHQCASNSFQQMAKQHSHILYIQWIGECRICSDILFFHTFPFIASILERAQQHQCFENRRAKRNDTNIDGK